MAGRFYTTRYSLAKKLRFSAKLPANRAFGLIRRAHGVGYFK